MINILIGIAIGLAILALFATIAWILDWRHL